MAGTGSTPSTVQFLTPEESLGGVDSSIAARVIAAAADIALVINKDGVIADYACGAIESRRASLHALVGKAWVETVAEDSVPKVEALLEEVSAETSTRSREINQRMGSGPDLPVRFSAVRLGEGGRCLAIGRDLRALANLQQQLVGAQQSMEREYARLRHLETRYRLLFRISSEPVVIVDSVTEKLTEANPAAAALLGDTPQRLSGRGVASLFEARSWEGVKTMLTDVRVAGSGKEVSALLIPSSRTVTVFASLFRQESASLFLMRLVSEPTPLRESEESRLLEVLRGLPDAFVMIDGDRRVMTANEAFLDLAQLATEQQARRMSLEEWLGRPGVDLNILMANLREHGSVRNFSTVMRGQYGSTEEVEVSGVSAINGEHACFGFMIRPMTSRFSFESSLEGDLPNNMQQLASMVGRVPLKEIIRRTTDVIESLCIEAALEVSGDNRASAAQMLGLSRQSLYAKLRRHGIGDLDGGTAEE